MNNRIKCLLVKPYELPEEIEIDNTLESFQKMVGGYIEHVYLPEDTSVILICNEEGKINRLKLNREIGYDIIAGDFLIVGDCNKEDYQSLTDEQILKYKIRFDENSIVRTENKINAILYSNMKNNYER